MKLAVVKHSRCNEDTGNRTLVWVSDEMTEEAFERAVEGARTEYLAFAVAFKNADAPNDYRPHSAIPYASYPEMTVAAVQREWATKKVAWDAWDSARQQARKTFGTYLYSRDGIQPFYKHDPPLAYECEWGHNHGVKLDYDETSVYD